MDTHKSAIPANSVEYPLLTDRVQSTFIDTLFILILTFISASILDKFDNVPDWIRIALFFGFWAIYEPLATTLGATIGNYVKGIRVRKYSAPDKKLNFLQAFIRYIFKVGLGWLSFLTLHTNKERRAIHDFVAGSVMIVKSL
jgi:uncharacterized RDD family membrane protein YckC